MVGFCCPPRVNKNANNNQTNLSEQGVVPEVEDRIRGTVAKLCHVQLLVVVDVLPLQAGQRRAGGPIARASFLDGSFNLGMPLAEPKHLPAAPEHKYTFNHARKQPFLKSIQRINESFNPAPPVRSSEASQHRLVQLVGICHLEERG